MKRIFWITIGIGIGVTSVVKIQNYVKKYADTLIGHTPLNSSDDLLLLQKTVETFCSDFQKNMHQRETELNIKLMEKQK
ncbi:MAG: hypothetical protein IKE94_14260 [Aeriscardovia sp.]|nr:hypothetical protein [Aeriscardovia sp.]MBR3359230.1 hypothetical protein [Aeriscardovia sp.]